jgi:hypothetical protein
VSDRPHIVVRVRPGYSGISDEYWSSTGWHMQRSEAIKLHFYDAISLICKERANPDNHRYGFTMYPAEDLTSQ